MSEYENYPENQAVKVWEKDGMRFSIILHPQFNHYCGYVRFTKRPLRKSGYDGFATYINVHGGITFYNADSEGFVYGFDCGHSGDWSEFRPDGKKWSLEEVTKQCESVGYQLKKARLFELGYTFFNWSLFPRKIQNRMKARILDLFHKVTKQKFNVSDNFGVMIKLLSGEL